MQPYTGMINMDLTAAERKQNKNTEEERKGGDRLPMRGHTERERQRGGDDNMGGRVRTTHPALIKPERSC